MSEALARKRCFNHAVREAAARCPSCARFYCRECVTEHEGRVLCVACLQSQQAREEAPRARGGLLVLAVQGISAVMLLWCTFFLLAEGFARLPDSFHEYAVWSTPFMPEDDEADEDAATAEKQEESGAQDAGA